MAVPFVNLAVPADEARVYGEAMMDVMQTGQFIGGPPVEAFEEAWAAYCGRRYCVGVSSGTDALTVALRSFSFGRAGRVAVPAMTFQATWEAVTLAGLTPVPVDITEDGSIDPTLIPDNVDVIIPVHLHGRFAPSPAADTDYPLILEDACQAHGANVGGRAAAAFSFYPTKNLGAMGDAGALVTDSPELARRFRELRDHGQSSKGLHAVVGACARLDAIQAAVLLKKLPRLDRWNHHRLIAADVYEALLYGVGDLALPSPSSGNVWHIYAIRTGHRDALAAHLAARGVGTGSHYPVPPHLTPAYAPLGHRPGSFPVAERFAAETLSLPLWPGITLAQQTEVADAIRSYFT